MIQFGHCFIFAFFFVRQPFPTESNAIDARDTPSLTFYTRSCTKKFTYFKTVPDTRLIKFTESTNSGFEFQHTLSFVKFYSEKDTTAQFFWIKSTNRILAGLTLAILRLSLLALSVSNLGFLDNKKQSRCFRPDLRISWIILHFSPKFCIFGSH